MQTNSIFQHTPLNDGMPVVITVVDKCRGLIKSPTTEQYTNQAGPPTGHRRSAEQASPEYRTLWPWPAEIMQAPLNGL